MDAELRSFTGQGGRAGVDAPESLTFPEDRGLLAPKPVTHSQSASGHHDRVVPVVEQTLAHRVGFGGARKWPNLDMNETIRGFASCRYSVATLEKCSHEHVGVLHV